MIGSHVEMVHGVATMWGTLDRVQLVNIAPITMVDGIQSYNPL